MLLASVDESATSGPRSPSGGSPASELRDYLNVGVLDNLNGTPSELLEYLNADRLRATWLAELAHMVGLGAFMAAAGVDCSQRLGDIVAGLPGLAEAEAVALLGGASW